MVDFFMKVYPGKLHIGSDGWSSPSVIAFLGVTVHWIIDSKMVSTILDFIKYDINFCDRLLNLIIFPGLHKCILVHIWPPVLPNVCASMVFRTRYVVVHLSEQKFNVKNTDSQFCWRQCSQ